MRQVAQGFCKVALIIIVDQTAGVEAIQKLEELYPQITQIHADSRRFNSQSENHPARYQEHFDVCHLAS